MQQRVILLTLGGEAAQRAAGLIDAWRRQSNVDTAAVDGFCETLRAQSNETLSIVYYAEWIDRWLMGDRIPGPQAIDGRRFQLTCFTREQALDWAGHCGSQFPEQEWLAARLREAAAAWCGSAGQALIVGLREVTGASATDDEIETALQVVATWMPPLPPHV